MADQFKRRWECRECFEQHDVARMAMKCCGSPAMQVFICEVCGRDWYEEYEARSCCFKIANPTPAARREVVTMPVPARLLDPDLGL